MKPAFLLQSESIKSCLVKAIGKYAQYTSEKNRHLLLYPYGLVKAIGLVEMTPFPSSMTIS